MEFELFDCTLRDGGNVTGGGVGYEPTVKVTEGLVANGVKFIEVGTTYGVGNIPPCAPGTPTDDEYIAAMRPFVDKAHIGFFFQPMWGTRADLEKLKAGGVSFVRIGSNVGMVEKAEKTVRDARDVGLETRFSLMKAWATTPEKLAEDARKIVDYGVQVVHIMDSTGSCTPDETSRYVEALVKAVDARIAFHGHNNLGLAIANALAAYRAGATSLDCSICGFARSAGNAPTEMLAVLFQRLGIETGVDVFGLLDFIAETGAEVLGAKNYVPPLDVAFGMAGFHSSFEKMARSAAEKHRVSLLKVKVYGEILAKLGMRITEPAR